MNITQMERAKGKLLAKRNVVGVGVGHKYTEGRNTGKVAIVVLVQQKLPLAHLSPEDLVPDSIEGVATDVMEVGHIRALGYTDKSRPAHPGMSIGHYHITAGTFGCVVYNLDGDPLILSNNHVLANTNQCQIGDPIYQPGPIDGGGPDDQIATLNSWWEIGFGDVPDPPDECPIAASYAAVGNKVASLFGRESRLQVKPKATEQYVNIIDAALARPLSPDLISDFIVEIGEPPKEVAQATLGMSVQKTGRTTEHTTGSIMLINATVQVDYGLGEPALFENQIITSNMSRGGDSGSLLVTNETSPKAVGLLFAGSSSATIHNPIQEVLGRLLVRLHHTP